MTGIIENDIVVRLRHCANASLVPHPGIIDVMREAASEIEHFRRVYGHITPDNAAKIKQFQESMREFQKQFPDKVLA